VADAGEATDLIAWQPRTGQLGSWRSYAWGLGQEEALCPRITDHDGLHVWRTPLQWLQANRRGVVIFRPRLAADLLADAGPLIAMDMEHGQELSQVEPAWLRPNNLSGANRLGILHAAPPHSGRHTRGSSPSVFQVTGTPRSEAARLAAFQT
jgi:hypothetical protein